MGLGSWLKENADTVGGVVGGAAGGVGGFFVGGPAGAAMGASAGYSLGSMAGGAIGGDDPFDRLSDESKAARKNLLQQGDFSAGRGVAYSQEQGALVKQLQDMASGKNQGTSLAQLQLREGLGRNVSNQQALLATGGNGRAAAMQSSALGGSLSAQLAQQRAAEEAQRRQQQAQAMSQLANIYQGRQGLGIQQQGVNNQRLQMQLNSIQQQQQTELQQPTSTERIGGALATAASMYRPGEG